MVDVPPNIKNVEFYNALLVLIRKLITEYYDFFQELWELKESNENFSYNPTYKYFKQNSKYANIRLDPTLRLLLRKNDELSYNLVDFLLNGMFEQLQSLKEYQNCIETMDKDPIIKDQINKYHHFSNMAQTMNHWTYISHVVKRTIFEYMNQHILNIDLVNDLYLQLESFLYNEYLDAVKFSGLHFFHTDNSVQLPIHLTKSVTIRSLADKEKIILSDSFVTTHDRKSTVNYIIEHRFKVKKGFTVGVDEQELDIPKNTEHLFFAIITLFRLIGVELAIYELITKPILDIPVYGWTLDLFVVSLGNTYGATNYVTMVEIAAFQKLWQPFGELLALKVFDGKRFDGDPFANLKTAINRFNYSYERKEGNDAFIDNIVALEALFSKEDDDFRRTTERLSKRLAIFLEADPHKRKEIFCEMIRLYDVRGKIIHGGFTQDINIVTTRDYLVKSFQKYFEFLKQDNFSHADFIRSLDLEAKKFSMKRKDCQVKHTHNDEYNYTSPDFLFT